MNPENPHTPHRSGQNPQGYGPAPQDYSQPVAYDNQGRPLYAHPPQGYNTGPSVVHVSRPINPTEQPIPPEIMRRSEEARKKYPNLNLSKGEYVIKAVSRHPIGLLQIWLVVGVLIVVLWAMYALLFLGQNPSDVFIEGGTDMQSGGALLLAALSVLFVLGGMVATYIYNSNHFYLTNESVIQEIQTSLFSRHVQTVSLSNIEDASHKQSGILQTLLNYGTIRLSTEGDETTYSFSYVAHPKKHIDVLNNAVEAFKNGRPVSED